MSITPLCDIAVIMAADTPVRSITAARGTSALRSLLSMVSVASRAASCLGAALTARNAAAVASVSAMSNPGATYTSRRARYRSTRRSDTTASPRCISRLTAAEGWRMPVLRLTSARRMRLPSWSRYCSTATSASVSCMASSGVSPLSSTKVSLSSFSPAGTAARYTSPGVHI